MLAISNGELGSVVQAPTIPFVSNLTGTWIAPSEAMSADYWVKHLRNTVRFADGIRTLCGTNSHVLLEVGPGRTLATLALKKAMGGSAGGAH